jgi:hypothetical protein
MTTTQSRPVFRVGDRVTFELVNRTVHGVVTENRGRLAPGGDYLYAIKLSFGDDEPMLIELPEDTFTLDTTPSEVASH